MTIITQQYCFFGLIFVSILLTSLFLVIFYESFVLPFYFYQKLEIEQSNKAITRIEESTNECLINLES